MTNLHRTIEAVWRMESARLIATLARMVRDVGLAEDLAQDALLAALETWPNSGIPAKPGAWLMTTAKNRAIDRIRRDQRHQKKIAEIGVLDPDIECWQPDIDQTLDRPIDDDLLSLIFTACHPVLSLEARVCLTLKILGGLSTDEIARAYLLQESTVAQRILRAKRSLSEARVPFEIPSGPELESRLNAVLEVIYLIFNEGYAATSGTDWMRPALCEEALRLGRILSSLMTQHSEVYGLLALMEIQASRIPARTDSKGQPVLLLDQNRARWDQLLIRRGLAALKNAELTAAGLTITTKVRPDLSPEQADLNGVAVALGPYTIQAEIAACHARAHTAHDTDWEQIAALYDALAQLMPSPVVELNRAVAIAMAYGPAAGLEIIESLQDEPALKNYHLLPSVQGDLLFKLGQFEAAASAFNQAASLTRNQQEQQLLTKRAAACQLNHLN